jgi:hypothetical protein
MTGPPLKLEYVPTDADLAHFTVKGQGYKASPSPFLATDPGQLIHGNSVIKVMDHGEDVSSNWNTWRQMRIWLLPSVGGVASASATLNVAWHDDNRAAKPNWLDIPGFIFTQAPSKTDAERYLMEFVVAVIGRPDVDALYFYNVVSRNAFQYRIQMSTAKSVPFSRWPEIKANDAAMGRRCRL